MKYNRTYTYIYPIVSTVINTLKDNLLNVFVGDVDHPKLDNHIFLLYEFSTTEKFLKYEGYLRGHKKCVKIYDPTPDTIMVVIEVPKKYKKIIKYYKEGKFSKFPKSYKVLICDFHNIFNSDHRVVQVLNKDERLYQELEERLGVEIPRDIDPSSKPNMEEECFNKLLFNQKTDFKVINED